MTASQAVFAEPKDKEIKKPESSIPSRLLHKRWDEFSTIEELKQTSFHKIRKIVEKKANKDSPIPRTFYYKINSVNSPCSEMEAVAAQIFKMFAPNLIPLTYVVVNEKGEPHGVISEEISGFIPIGGDAGDPLYEENLNHDYLKKANILTLEKLDDELRALEVKAKAEFLKKKQINPDHKEEEFEAEEASDFNPDDCKSKNLPAKSATTTEWLFSFFSGPPPKPVGIKLKTECVQKIQKLQTIGMPNISKSNHPYISKEMIEFYRRIAREHKLTPQEMDNFRMIRGQGICVTTSHFVCEADLHALNYSKWGERIDLDMAFWTISYPFKESILKGWRAPTERMFKFTLETAEHFPKLPPDAGLIYWPTIDTPPLRLIADDIRDYFNISYAKNKYPNHVPELFRKMEKHPVFKHYAFATWTKIICSFDKIYESAACLHMVPNREEFKNLIRFIKTRILEEFEVVLFKLPPFLEFFVKFGDFYKEQFRKDLAEENIPSEFADVSPLNGEEETILDDSFIIVEEPSNDDIEVVDDKTQAPGLIAKENYQQSVNSRYNLLLEKAKKALATLKAEKALAHTGLMAGKAKTDKPQPTPKIESNSTTECKR